MSSTRQDAALPVRLDCRGKEAASPQRFPEHGAGQGDKKAKGLCAGRADIGSALRDRSHRDGAEPEGAPRAALSQRDLRRRWPRDVFRPLCYDITVAAPVVAAVTGAKPTSGASDHCMEMAINSSVLSGHSQQARRVHPLIARCALVAPKRHAELALPI